MSKNKTVKGFTLIEILVVVALIAILTAITFIAINPAKNFADTRNAQRSSDVTQILNAVTQYTSEQGHQLSDFHIAGGVLAIPTCTGVAGYGAADIGTADGNVDLSELVSDYIVGIPTDPQFSSAYIAIHTPLTSGNNTVTGYTICKTTDTGGRVRISAPNVEQTTPTTKVISVLR
jgi:prepilin-type N-terminal cleavage/methylation domain-containing protein